MDGIITRSYSGGKDLYYGIPNLNGATVIDITYKKENTEEYETNLILKTIDNKIFTITIKQDKY